ncbi:hypothetical protein LTR42_001966 [Elasticomyces elasticus]|nr:hypothetical protein LTR42_001966 [Elasticomyces elasticus]
MSTYGAGVLYLGQEPITADIFFVHGLAGDRRATWTKDDIFWPQDLLKAQIPHARILTFGYDADPIHFFRLGGQNHQTIFSHAQDLLTAVKNKRDDPKVKDRPIVFVGHSLGGLVIKQVRQSSSLQKAILIMLGAVHRT